MRKIFLTIIILSVFHNVSYAAEFINLSDGKIQSTADDSDDRPRKRTYESYGSNYQKGYIEGYTYNGGRAREAPPAPPAPPAPNAGETAQDAYTRGILDGRRNKQS